MKIPIEKKIARRRFMGGAKPNPSRNNPVPAIEIECPDGVWRRNVPNPPRPCRFIARPHGWQGHFRINARFAPLLQLAGRVWRVPQGHRVVDVDKTGMVKVVKVSKPKL